MTVPASPIAGRLFSRLLAAPGVILVVFLLLGALGIYGATRIPDDNAIGSLTVAEDPDARATAAFERLFPEGVHALLMLETPDPLTTAALQGVDQLERRLAKIPGVDPQSLLTIYRGANPGTALAGADTARIAKFATGTRLFTRAGLLGPHFLGVALELHVRSPVDRDRMLDAIDAAITPLLRTQGGPFER